MSRSGSVTLVVGGKAYVVAGSSGTPLREVLNLTREVWEYEPSNDEWTKRRDFTGRARSMAVGFTLGSDIYFGLGNDAEIQNLRDFRRASVSASGH